MTQSLKSTPGIISILLLLAMYHTSYVSYAYATSSDDSSYDTSDVSSDLASDQADTESADTESEFQKDLNIPVEQKDADEIDVIIGSIRQIVSNDANAIIIVSMSGVLFLPTDKEFFVKDPSYKSVWQKALSATKESKLNYMEEVIFTQYEHKAVDERIIKFISEMIDRGVRVIVVTANSSGRFNDIAYLEEWTVKWLKDRGIDLNKSVYRDTKFVMNQYSSERSGSYPTFYKGLLSCSTDKAYNGSPSIIATFFVTMNERPANVAMIHNNKDILRITEQQIKSINDAVQFFGYNINNTLEKIITEDYASDITPKSYLSFWKKLGTQLNAVVRGNSKNSDRGNPYEEDL